MLEFIILVRKFFKGEMMKYNGIELVPIKDSQIFNPPREMLCWNDVSEKWWTQKVLAIITSEDFPVLYMDEDGEYDGYKYCAEIPKPQKREMNSLEVMEYLHLLQLALNNCEKTFTFSVEIDKMFGGVVLYSNEAEKHSVKINYSILESGNDLKNKYYILKNGKVTEFELPEIEI